MSQTPEIERINLQPILPTDTEVQRVKKIASVFYEVAYSLAQSVGAKDTLNALFSAYLNIVAHPDHPGEVIGEAIVGLGSAIDLLKGIQDSRVH